MKEFVGKHILKIVENLSVPFDKRVWREANTLHNAGSSVSIICPCGKNYDKKSLEILNGIEIYRYNLPLEGIASKSKFSKITFIFEYFIAFIKTFILALKIYIKKPFHVIHVANPPDIFFILGFIYKLFGVKFVFDHHDLCPEAYLDKKDNPRKDIFYILQLIFERITFMVSDIVISTNNSYKKIAISRGKKKPKNVFVVRNGPDENNYKIVEVDKNIRNGFKYLVGYIGVMAKLDGVDNLIHAADFIINTKGRNDIGFVLIGTGTSIDELKILTDDLKLNKYVRFTGRISDIEVFKILSSIDIGAAPDPPSFMNDVSTMNKIMDYMWFGKPIVSFNLNETKYSASDAAMYSKSSKPEEFGELIIKLINDPQKRKSMGTYGKKRVKSLTWQKSEKELLMAYEVLFSFIAVQIIDL